MMKNNLFTFALALGLAASFGCQSSAQKVESAKENVRDADAELREERKNAWEDGQKATANDEWKLFKLETKLKIEKNDQRIAELRAKKSESGKAMDSFYTNRINGLEQSNKDLKDRLDNYQKNGGDWEQFKREFNRSLNELVKAIEDLGNKK